jgi:predicted methyltransferase
MKTLLSTVALILGAALVVSAPTQVYAGKKAAKQQVAAPVLDAETAAALDLALAGAHRKEADKARDGARHPAAMLAFFGLKNTMTVIEVSPGGGWWTDVLAPVLRDKGTLIAAQNTNVNGTARRSLGATLTRFAATPDVFGKVQLTNYDVTNAAPLGPDNSADMVLVMRHMHGLIGNNLADKALKMYFNVLKPGGVLAVEQHRWPEGKPYPERQESWGYVNNGYIKESDVIKMAEAAGFKLAGKSEINANPKDSKDHVNGVWSLPPVLRGGDVDKDKFMAIGESDRMTLKFVKPAAG